MTFDASQSFIPAAASALSDRSGKKAILAKHIDKFEGTFEDRVFQAYAQSFSEDATYYPIQILGYVQDLMDKVCWNARRVLKSYHLPEEVYGCDPLHEDFHAEHRTQRPLYYHSLGDPMKNPKSRKLFVDALNKAYEEGRRDDPLVQLVQSRLMRTHSH